MERNAVLDTVITIRKSYLSRQNLNRDLKKVSKPVVQLSEGRVFRPREEQVPKLEHAGSAGSTAELFRVDG